MQSRGGSPAGDPSPATASDPAAPGPPEPLERAFIDLHCHTRASFDSLANPLAAVRAARSRGLTHLAITDHDRIDAALEAQAAAIEGLHVIVGEEIKTADGDMIGLFIREVVPPGLSAQETIAAVREQGGVIGVPHPFDRFRGFGRGGIDLEAIAAEIDWVEGFNARVMGGAANERAGIFARDHGLPSVAASDAHTVIEVGVAYNVVDGDPSTPAGLLAALASVQLVIGHASYYVRAWTPIAKLVQTLRGNGRVAPVRRQA